MISLGFCGDILFKNSVAYSNPLDEVNRLFNGCDIVLFNLETVLSSSGKPVLQKRHIISECPENLQIIKTTAKLVAHVANNHILDYGESGFRDTIKVLEENEVHPLGMKDGISPVPVIIEVKGIRIGFLGYGDYGFPAMAAPIRPRRMIDDVSSLKRQVDFVILSLHWGYEYVNYPSPSQQSLARALINNGVHIIVGHHPHIVQGIEEYREGLVAYSLGNLQFHIPGTPEVEPKEQGFIMKLTLRSGKPSSKALFPVQTMEDGRVAILEGDLRSLALTRIEELSLRVNGRKVGYLFWILNTAPVYFPDQITSWGVKVSKYGRKQWVKFIFWIIRPLNLAMAMAYLFAAARRTYSRFFR